MKNHQNKTAILRLAMALTLFFVFTQTATAQQLKPKEIIYSRLPTDLNQSPTGANSPTIWAVGQDGGGDRQIAVGMEPRISDDGRYLLFRRIVAAAGDVFHYNPYASQAQGNLWVRDLANSSETMIFDFSSGNRRLFGYYFSPESNQGNYQIILDYGTLFYKFNLDGTNTVALDPYFGGGVPRENDTFPVLRRGDSFIVANNRDRSNFGLMTRTLGSDAPFDMPNTTGNDWNPSWSNDNQLVGFTTLRVNGCLNFDSSVGCNYPYFFNKINKIKPDGSNRALLSDLSATNTNGIAFGTVWTEDNSKIIAAARINGVASLYAFTTNGSGVFTRIPISNGNAPDFVGGIVQPRNDAQLISNGGGVMTDQNGSFTYDGNNVVNTDGSISPVQPDVAQALQFSLVDSIGEPIAGDGMSGGGFSFQSGFQPNTPPNIAGGNGTEGDVAGRPNGDGQVLANDVVEVQRFQIGLDQPFQSNEFQRVDSAPFVSHGDGAIQANDAIQTQRFQIGLEQSQNAAGPVYYGSSFASPTTENIVSSPTATRQVRAESTNAAAGQPVTVNIRVDAVGDESAYGFTLNYNAAVLTATSTQIGTAGGSRLCNLTVPGQVRCSIINFPDDQVGSDTDQIGEIHAGDNQLLMKINFTLPANAQSGTSSLVLASADASNDLATNLAITTQSGTVTVIGMTAAGASVGGRVLTNGRGLSGANVIITDAKGGVRTTTTSGFGYFRFDEVRAGETYVVKVSSKRFTFAPQVVNVTADLSNLTFTAQ